MVAERFEDLTVWQRARAFASVVFEATQGPAFRRDAGLCDQLNRAAASISANIAEGYERNSRAELHRFLGIAKGLCGECRSHFYIALDRGRLSSEEFERLRDEAEQISRMLSSMRTQIQKQRPTPNRVQTRSILPRGTQ